MHRSPRAGRARSTVWHAEKHKINTHVINTLGGIPLLTDRLGLVVAVLPKTVRVVAGNKLIERLVVATVVHFHLHVDNGKS